MLRYVALRIALMVPALLAISVIVFVLIELPPGDYLSNEMTELAARGETASLARLQFLRDEFSLDAPLIERYAIWLGVMPGASGFHGLLQGNWGWSFEYGKPVADVIGDRLGLTIALNFATILFVYAIAFPIGVYSATRQYSWGDYGFTVLGYLGLAVPNFLLGLILLYYANLWFGLSVGGLMAPEFIDQPWSMEKLGSVLAHLVVPTVVIGLSGTAAMIRRLRANLLDELGKPYVAAARARGLSERRLIIKYPLRAALGPFVADVGNLLPSMVSGAVIVSVVLNLPTVGPVLISALRSQDQFLAGFILLFAALLTVVGMLISDLLLAALDPRVRIGQRAVR